MITKAHQEEELRGLAYSLTERISSSNLPWGTVLPVFGALMLLFGVRAGRRGAGM